jgi:hypothetical protein
MNRLLKYFYDPPLPDPNDVAKVGSVYAGERLAFYSDTVKSARWEQVRFLLIRITERPPGVNFAWVPIIPEQHYAPEQGEQA